MTNRSTVRTRPSLRSSPHAKQQQCFARSAFARVRVRVRRERVHDLLALLGSSAGEDTAAKEHANPTKALSEREVRALKKDVGYDLLDSGKDESLIERMLSSLLCGVRSHCVTVDDPANAYKAYKDATMRDPLCSTAQVCDT